jgi:aspartyl-tRNA(Asn)/glutamyl-tRNA(Gln) amidotransferase subunit A
VAPLRGPRLTAELRDELKAFLARPDTVGEGMRLGVKDLFDTAGLVTTYGSAIFRGHVPERTAEAVRLLEAAGHVIVGKTNLHEFAYGITSENPHFGNVVNPLARNRTPGGSSGGSAAALATGMCDLALGSDSGGSIRIPAACCGVVGFKPTHGLVSTEGLFPLAPSFDHAGPMAPSAAACQAAMEILAPGFRPRTLESLEQVRVGVAWTELAEPLVRARAEDAASLFPRRRPIDFPLPERISRSFQWEAAQTHRDLFRAHADLYGANVRKKIELCLRVTDDEHREAERERSSYRERCEEVMEGLDLLITPTLESVAPPASSDEFEIRERVIRFTFPFNALGWPALALPCGPAESGLPASLQIVGRPGDDALVLAAGSAIEPLLR